MLCAELLAHCTWFFVHKVLRKVEQKHDRMAATSILVLTEAARADLDDKVSDCEIECEIRSQHHALRPCGRHYLASGDARRPCCASKRASGRRASGRRALCNV